MKKILTILLFVTCLGANAQTEREILLDISKQVNKLNEQMTTNNTKIDVLEKTTAITSAKMESLEKNVDKRLDGIDKRLDFMQTLLIIIIPLVLTSVVGIVGFVLWDRSTAMEEVRNKKYEVRT